MVFKIFFSSICQSPPDKIPKNDFTEKIYSKKFFLPWHSLISSSSGGLNVEYIFWSDSYNLAIFRLFGSLWWWWAGDRMALADIFPFPAEMDRLFCPYIITPDMELKFESVLHWLVGRLILRFLRGVQFADRGWNWKEKNIVLLLLLKGCPNFKYLFATCWHRI